MNVELDGNRLKEKYRKTCIVAMCEDMKTSGKSREESFKRGGRHAGTINRDRLFSWTGYSRGPGIKAVKQVLLLLTGSFSLQNVAICPHFDLFVHVGLLLELLNGIGV
jgi:hypothetical protein